MLRCYRVANDTLEELPAHETGCLIRLSRPTPEELASIRTLAQLNETVLADALDPDERPRMDVDQDLVYIVFRAPWIEGNPTRDDFTTPVTIVFTDSHTIIIDPHGCRSLEDFFSPLGARHIRDTRARIMACLFRTIANRYLVELRNINAVVRRNEKNLGGMNERRQLELLHMQNCLTYFEAALRGNELTMERIQRTRLHLESAIPFAADDDDGDMFDDTLTDIRQAFYTSRIYAEIMDSLMRAHATVIGAKVNAAMKILTSLTLVLMLPTLVTSAYGMNVPLPFQNVPHAFLLIGLGSFGLSLVSIFFLWKKGWFSASE